MLIILCHYICIVLFVLDRYSNGIVVFQPAFIVTKQQTVTAFLLGNSSHLSLTLSTVQPSNTTGRLPLPNCAENEPGQWTITREALRTNIVKVQLSLNRSLQLCANGTDCCPEPLCVLETLRIQACHGDLHQATLLVQAEIYAQVFPTGPVSDNRTVIPNQAYQPLGPCACDLTIGTCDVLCCCDRDCSPDVKLLFESQCFPGVFGGNVTPIADYNCSVQLSKNSPDWFPFLCVTSPSNNSPFLGLFYQGKTILPKRSPSFQAPVLITPVPVGAYRQGDPILTESDKYFTIPQQSLVGQCVDNAPVAFLKNFRTSCPFRLLSCPTRPPLLTNPSELKLRVRDGLGGVVTVSVKDEVVTSLSPFVSSSAQTKQANPTESSLLPRFTQASTPDPLPANLQKLCENVTLALDYLFFWKANGLTSITLTRTIGNVALNPNVFLTVRFSAVFVNGNASVQPNSGNPGYLIGKSVIGGSVGTLDNGIDYIQRASISLWQPVGEGLCSSASTKAVRFGENATAGCLLYLSVQNLTQCNQLRETTRRTLAVLLTATHVARNGNPDYSNVTEWVNITYVPLNVSSQTVNAPGSCENIPSHLNINIRTTRADLGGGQPQRLIQAVEVSYILSTWRVQCGGGDPVPCLNPAVTQPFPISSAVTFSDIPVQTGPPKTRFQINFTEFDCDRNDVCWPQLAYPLTRYYTGEPYSQSLAKGLILVFFFIAVSVLGTPWRQIRQAWG